MKKSLVQQFLVPENRISGTGSTTKMSNTDDISITLLNQLRAESQLYKSIVFKVIY